MLAFGAAPVKAAVPAGSLPHRLGPAISRDAGDEQHRSISFGFVAALGESIR